MDNSHPCPSYPKDTAALRALSQHTNQLSAGYLLVIALVALITVACFHALGRSLEQHGEFVRLMSLTNVARSASTRIADRSGYLRNELSSIDPDPLLIRQIGQDITSDLNTFQRVMTELQAAPERHDSGRAEPLRLNRYLYEAPHQLLIRADLLNERTRALLALTPERSRESFSLWSAADTAFTASGVVTQSFDLALEELEAALQNSIAGVTELHRTLTLVVLATLLLAAILIFAPLLRRTRRRMQGLLATKEQLLHQASHDGGTGYPNQTRFTEQYEARYRAAPNDGAPASARTAVFVLLRVDNLDLLFDRYGHSGVERLRSHMARSVDQLVDASCLRASLSDRHLAVVLEGKLDTRGNAERARQLLARVNERPEGLAPELPVRQSISIALLEFDPLCYDAERLYADAELALARPSQRAGSVGPNLEVYHPEIRQEFEALYALEADIARALESGEFMPWYQPKLSADGDRVVGFEALARWQHPTRGLLKPDQFIGVAERSVETITRLTLSLLSTIATQRACWHSLDIPIAPISVNLPNCIFTSDWALERVCTEVNRLNRKGRIIDLEVTEDAMVDAGADAIANRVTLLQATGAQIALDDFGTGSASLHGLMNIDCDEVKIDRKFISTCVTDRRSRAIVESVMHLARQIGAVTTAEGVENAKQFALMRELGCEQIQGFFLARPMPADDIPAYLSGLPRGAALRLVDC